MFITRAAREILWRDELEKDEDFIQIDLAYLSSLVRGVCQNPWLVVQVWQAQRLRGGFQLNSSIYRLQGHALDAGNLVPWSLKIMLIY